MPSAVPIVNGPEPTPKNIEPTTNGDMPSPNSAAPSANDNIRRFAAPSRPLSPRAEHTLFHNKTRCFV